MNARKCQVCGQPANHSFRCAGCGAFCYCSDEHRNWHKAHGHNSECARMSEQMKRRSELENLPILWKGDHPCEKLWESEFHTHGPGRSECTCEDVCSLDSFLGNESRYRRRVHSNIAEEDLIDWKSLCKWIGIPLKDPCVLSLDFAATVLWGIKLALGIPHQQVEKALVIHYLGPERELDLLNTFSILGQMLKMQCLQIYFVGPSVTQDAFIQLRENVSVSLVKGMYHHRYPGLPLPDVVVALNAGLAAYPSWIDTVRLLHLTSLPFVVTDYCEEALLRGICMLRHQGMSDIGEITINPFRKPLMLDSDDNLLPSCSNGFICCIKSSMSRPSP